MTGVYQPCVLGSDGRCTRSSHDHGAGHERSRFFEARYDDMRRRVERSLDLLDGFDPVDAYDVDEVRGLVADLRQTLFGAP